MPRWIKPFWISCLLAAPLAAEGTIDLLAPTIALYVDFEGTPAQRSVDEMKREVATLLEPSGLRVDWRSLQNDTGSDDIADLYVLKFHGKCDIRGPRVLFSELGPYGETTILGAARTVENNVLPFGNIECDAVRKTVAPRIVSRNPAQQDAAFGRALGRVLAHELYHMMSKSSAHAGSGIFKASYRSQDLVADRFAFEEHEGRELKRIADRMSGRSPAR